MTDTIIHIDGETAAGVLDEHGWTQGSYGRAGAVCLHGAIRLCQPHPGDAYLIEQVEARLGRWSTSWNDANGRTQGEVRAVLAAGLDYTDQDLADTFGPQWRAVVALVRRAAVLTPNEAKRLDAAWEAARGAAMDAAIDAAWGAARAAAWRHPWRQPWVPPWMPPWLPRRGISPPTMAPTRRRTGTC